MLNILCVESDSVLWVGTNHGLNKVTYTNGEIHTESYDESNGLPSKKVNDLVIVNGHIWIATDEGVSSFN